MCSDFDNLQKYYEAFIITRGDSEFSTLYNEAVRLFKGIHRGAVISSRIGDKNDADTIFDDTILKISQREGITGFGAMFLVCLKHGRIDLARKVVRQRAQVAFSLDDDKADLLDSGLSCSDEYEHRRKEIEQRELLQFLVDRSGDKVATAIASLNSTFTEKFSVNALCTAANIHHMTGGRALQRLARYYDSKTHGDISEYLPSDVRIKRQYLTA